jgi:monoamine oxidase
MTLADRFEVVVIGAGAAGLAAGARLAEAGLGVSILEARPRIGGRAHTLIGQLRFPLDLGCGWLHSANRNPWTEIASAAGFSIDKTRPLWGKQSRDLSFSAEEQQDFEAAFEQFEAKIAKAGLSGTDIPAASLLAPGGRWNALIYAVSTYMNGAELDEVSLHDLNLYADTGVNWRIAEGYGAAIEKFGVGLPIRLGCKVLCVDHSGTKIAVEASEGRLSAHAVIVTIPTSLLAAEAITFTPDLPEKAEAAAYLPLGVNNKIFIGVDRAELLPIEGHVFGRTDQTATGSYHLRPFGRPLIEGFFGGTFARELEKDGPKAFFEFASAELCGLFGEGLRPNLSLLTATSWALDSFAQGSYSHALPGHADARKILAASVDDRLFFAGEACSVTDFSTAHGAYATGIEAAKQVIAVARRRNPRDFPRNGG